MNGTGPMKELNSAKWKDIIWRCWPNYIQSAWYYLTHIRNQVPGLLIREILIRDLKSLLDLSSRSHALVLNIILIIEAGSMHFVCLALISIDLCVVPNTYLWTCTFVTFSAVGANTFEAASYRDTEQILWNNFLMDQMYFLYLLADQIKNTTWKKFRNRFVTVAFVKPTVWLTWRHIKSESSLLVCLELQWIQTYKLVFLGE